MTHAWQANTHMTGHSTWNVITPDKLWNMTSHETWKPCHMTRHATLKATTYYRPWHMTPERIQDIEAMPEPGGKCESSATHGARGESTGALAVCSLLCAVWSVKCSAVCSVGCLFWSVQCEVCSVKCKVCIVTFKVFSVQHALDSVQCVVCNV